MIDGLVLKALEGDPKPESVRQVYEQYMLVDERCAALVIEWLTAEFTTLDDEAKKEGHGLAPLVGLAYLAAARYSNRDAVRLMLEMAIFDVRDTNPNTEHPLRKLADLCTRVHPDIPATADPRALVSSVLTEFLPDEPSDEQWRVWAAVAQSVLTPHVRGTFSSPEDHHRFNIIETIVAPDDAAVILDQLWPPIRHRLRVGPAAVVAEFVGVVHEWLRVGAGYDHPFGQDHPQAAVERAAVVGEAMLDDVVGLIEGKPGLIARVTRTASMFDIELPEELTAEVQRNPFFRDVDRLDDWQAGVEDLRSEIADHVVGWAAEPADLVVERLNGVRTELRTAGLTWPDRVWMACQVLAERVEDLGAWVEASLRGGLFPDAAPFLERLMTSDPRDVRRVVEDCLGDVAARGHVLNVVLAHSHDEDLLDLAVSRLTPNDFGLFDMLIIREQLSVETQFKILCRSPEATRGAFAVALAARTEDPNHSISAELREAFLEAVLEIRPAELSRNAGHQLVGLIQFLGEHHPDTLEGLIRRRLDEVGDHGLFEALGYDVWRELHVLPQANKTSLFQAFDTPGVRWFLFEHLVGPDADWLEELLNDGVVSPEEGLRARGFHGRIPIERMAALLVPRGIDPAEIASLAMSGTWWGEESTHYEHLVEQFEAYAEAEDPSVAAVGRAGVEVFARARDEARERERQRRIRGGI